MSHDGVSIMSGVCDVGAVDNGAIEVMEGWLIRPLAVCLVPGSVDFQPHRYHVVGGGDDRGRRRDAGSHYVGNVLETTHQNDT